jgi:hypothetical protein
MRDEIQLTPKLAVRRSDSYEHYLFYNDATVQSRSTETLDRIHDRQSAALVRLRENCALMNASKRVHE